MIASEQQADVQKMVEQLYALEPDWATFYREVLGVHGIVRRMFPDRESLAEFEQTELYQDIMRMVTRLRQQGPVEFASQEPTRVITVRLPKSLHETLREEAHEHRTSINKLCISKLLQFVDGEQVPVEG